VELIERLVLSMTNPGQIVFDPFLGTGTSIIAAVRHGRHGMGAEMQPRYVALAKARIQQELAGTLKTRPMDRPVHDPLQSGNRLTESPWNASNRQLQLLDQSAQYELTIQDGPQ
jgi:adenine-specific DNA-methyltransferase